MRIALIANPASGGGLGAKQIPDIKNWLQAKQIEYDLFLSDYHTHHIQTCARLDIKKYEAVVSIGGDGTNFQMLNGLLSAFAPNDLPVLGILPVGSGNSFAKDLGIHRLEDGLAAISGRNTRAVDVCSFSQNNTRHYFVNLTGLGFVTDVAHTAHKFKVLKDFSYIIGVLHRTIGLAFHEIELIADGKHYSGQNCFVEFCNSRYTGGNMLMAPHAKIDDGLMDIVIAGKLSRLSLLKTLPKLFKGTHIHHNAVTYVQAKKAIIKTCPEKKLLPDGEIFGSTPTTVEVHPRLVRYCI